MRDTLEAVEIAALMGATFSFALLVGWAALQAFFKVLTASLTPAVAAAPRAGRGEAAPLDFSR